MDRLASEEPKLTQHSAPPGYWGWELPEKSISIHISLDVVERLLTSIIDGFGSIPKRGAEVGGLLIGAHTPGSGVWRIEEFVDVPIRHKLGPSYLLSDEDHEALGAAVARAGESSIIGFYRSHTREGLFLTAEDNALIARYFPNPEQIVLLVRPSAMNVSMAGFFYRGEDGKFPEATPKEFPFRRSELETGSAPVRRPLHERMRGEMGRRPLPPGGLPPPRAGQQQPPQSPSPEPLPMPRRDEPPAGLNLQPASQAQQAPAPIQLPYALRPSSSSEEDIPMPSQVYAVTTPSQSRFRKGWYWLPLSFIFLLVGVLLGFQAAMTIYPTSRAGAVDAYSLALSISRSGDDVTVRWDRQNAAVRTSPRGILEITDGKYSKHVDLDAIQLQSGSVIYRFSSNQLKFKLEVFPQERVSISETVEWNGGSAPSSAK